MKILLDIDDRLGLYFMEALKRMPYVKAQQLTDAKAKLLKEFREAIIEMQQIKAGEKEGKDINDLLNEI